MALDYPVTLKLVTSLRSYEDVVRFFESLIDYEKRARERFSSETREEDLERFRRALVQLGAPQFCADVFHVAGTKGKGSTCAMLASVLTAAGKRVGLYTSPHLETFCERIRNGENPITEAELVRLIEELAPKVEREAMQAGGGFRTVFELLTAAAFVHFQRSRVDTMVIETGLGGRLDATNVFQSRLLESLPHVRPGFLMNVITAIGFDHMEILGNTLEDISREKAGIFQKHAAVVVGPQRPEYRRVVHATLSQHAREVGCRGVYFVEALVEGHPLAISPETNSQHPLAWRISLTPEGHRCFAQGRLGAQLRQGLVVTPGLLGPHQIDNARTVVTAALVAEKVFDVSLDRDALVNGLKFVRWPGRFEVLSWNPPVVVDGAHCELSTRAMVETYRRLWGNRPTRLVLGMMRDKAADRIMSALVDALPVAKVYCCQPPTPRGLPASEAAAIFGQCFECEAIANGSPEEAIRRAWKDFDPAKESLLAFGSLYLVAPYRTTLLPLVQARPLPSRDRP